MNHDPQPVSLVEIWALQYRLAELTAENEELKEQVLRMSRANVSLAKRLADLTPKEKVLR